MYSVNGNLQNPKNCLWQAGPVHLEDLTVSEFKVWVKFSEWMFDDLTCLVGKCEHGPVTAIEGSQNNNGQDYK